MSIRTIYKGPESGYNITGIVILYDLPESQSEFAFQIPDHGVEERGG